MSYLYDTAKAVNDIEGVRIGLQFATDKSEYAKKVKELETKNETLLFIIQHYDLLIKYQVGTYLSSDLCIINYKFKYVNKYRFSFIFQFKKLTVEFECMDLKNANKIALSLTEVETLYNQYQNQN